MKADVEKGLFFLHNRGRCEIFEIFTPLGCVLLELCSELLDTSESFDRDRGQQVLQALFQPLK